MISSGDDKMPDNFFDGRPLPTRFIEEDLSDIV